jgi:hypothetical protein
MKTISLVLLFLSLKVHAVEYVCWQIPALQGLAFESSATNCIGGKKEKGNTQRINVEKKIVCMIPAMCVALTPNIVEILKMKTGLSQVSDIKKLDGKLIHIALQNTPYMGRQSTVICEGTGTSKPNGYGILAFDQAKCPSFTACANSEELFYNQSVSFPTASDNPGDVMTNPTPARTTPTEVIQ